MSRPRVLIEDWLPIEELSIESTRERAAPNALPPLSFLHVWWARRPWVACAGVVLASVLPTWSKELAEEFAGHAEIASEDEYKAWYLRLCGILGDPIAGLRLLDAANAQGRRVDGNGYGYRPAFNNSPSATELSLLQRVLVATWGRIPTTFDPTAGGGSIPYEAARYGIVTSANDLNAVAAVILRAGVQAPSKFGPSLRDPLERWGRVLVQRVSERLAEYFEREADNESVIGYLFSRTIVCPRTGKLVPLSPNWWLSKEAGKQVAVRLLTVRGGRELTVPDFELLFGQEAVASNPEKGTVAGGDAVSPWDGLTIDGDFIKAEAQAGRMGSLLYAVAVRLHKPGSRPVRTFRTPTRIDLEAIAVAEATVAKLLPQWLTEGIVPTEEVSRGNKTSEPLRYGVQHWRNMFSPRQLLVHGVFVEEFRKLVPEVRVELDREEADAVLGLLGMMQGKALNYDSMQCRWNPPRNRIVSTFERHDFAIKWTFVEFDAARALFPWCLEQLTGSYEGAAELLLPSDHAYSTGFEFASPVPAPVSVSRANAGNLVGVESGSQTLVCIDPPYYDNVMYGELSDFFGVWEHLTIGKVWPDLMPEGLADVVNEAVANPARFVAAGRRKNDLATADYQAKMQAIFAECHRVLHDDGVLSVMFTHKKATAWDTLGTALMEAGFTIETSWPVNTEAENSLNQARQNSVSSTIMLVCRKREHLGDAHRYFEDLEGDVRAAARSAVERFSAAGISGVDLLLSTYGPALSVISGSWPVYSTEADATGRARLLRPEEALDAAREEVVKLQRQRLIGLSVGLDALTDFVLLAWSTFKAASFPYDEARRLALAVGGQDVESLVDAKVLSKQSGTVTLLPPNKRLRRRGDDKPGVRADATSFAAVIDAADTVLYLAESDGLPAGKALIDRLGLASDERFLTCLQGLVRSLPRTRDKGRWVLPQAGVLDALITSYFPGIEVPVENEWTGRFEFELHG